MAVSLVPTTKPTDELVFVAPVDDAIDWRNCFTEFDTVEEKAAEYKKDYDHTKLAFLEDRVPTFFVFADPKITTKKSDLLLSMMDVRKGGMADVDAQKAVFNILGIGVRENGTLEEYVRDKRGNIRPETMQGLEDCNALRDIGGYLLTVGFKESMQPKMNDAQKK